MIKLMYIIATFFYAFCIAQNKQKPNIRLYINSYNNDTLYHYKHYNSLSGEFKVFENTSTSNIDKTIFVNISDKEIIQFYDSIKNLKIKKEKLCINEFKGKYDSEIILLTSETVISKDALKNVKCTKDENKKDKILMLSLKLLKVIKSKDDYKIAFPMEFETM